MEFKRQLVTVYSSVCGRSVPIKSLNLGKQAERNDIKYFKIKNMEIKNGVLLGRKKHDWIAGANSPINKIVLMPSLNWKQHLSKQELQFLTEYTYDTLFCVTFSALKIIASLFNYFIKAGLMSIEDMKWLKDEGYLINGEVNFNERWIGVLGGTTDQGSYQYKVGNAIKNFGLLAQGDFPMADNFNDNIDKKFCEDWMFAKGKRFIKRFFINYNWVLDNGLDEALKYSPVQTIVKFANYTNPSDILKPEGSLNHSVVDIFLSPSYNEVSDTYNQEFKRYGKNYTHSYMAYSLTLLNNTKNMTKEKFLLENDRKWVRNINTGAFGRILQETLFVAKTKDRATLMLLDDKVRENGITISDTEWNELPKEDF